MARYPQPRSALLPMLHLVQSVEGRVTPEGIEACADLLGLTAAEVSAVATFYTMYKRKPVGDYHVGVCTNTLCAIMGGDLIFERLKDHLEVGQRRDHRGRQGHARAHRVQRRLRLRAGDDGELGVLRQQDPGVRHPAGRRPARGHRGDLARGAPGSAPGGRPSGCWPVSPTAAPTRARRPARPPWPGSGWPGSGTGARPATGPTADRSGERPSFETPDGPRPRATSRAGRARRCIVTDERKES